ncbi:MAG: hypothetical protein JSS14_29395 [Proteobacteria bacterium]|nr:hypothetical protein [Pseudomonadota bacterium]
MAYAAYRDHEVLEVARCKPRQAACYQVLHVTVSCADAWRVRQALAGCAGAGVVRCEPLLHELGSSAESVAPRARLAIRLARSGYVDVVRAVLRAVPSGELGCVMNWREHLRRCALETERP